MVKCTEILHNLIPIRSLLAHVFTFRRGFFIFCPTYRLNRLPAEGGAVIVSNHGRLDLDCFILAGLILRSRGRLVRLMADHLWFRIPVVRRLWGRAGAVDGTRENAARLLSGGELVLAYPGGVREIMSGRFGHEHLDWAGRTGFARVAIEAGVPVIVLEKPPVIWPGYAERRSADPRVVPEGRLLASVSWDTMLEMACCGAGTSTRRW